MHRFTYYFINIVENKGDPFYKGLNVDGEYNRRGKGGDIKRNEDKGRIFPDVVVHHRGDVSNNLCLIEFKKYYGEYKADKESEDTDLRKLINLTRNSDGFHYKWGVHITFYPQRKK